MTTAVVAGGFIHVDLAAPEFVADRDPGDEHVYPHPHALTKCPECGCLPEPEPTDEERARLLAEPDFNWFPPDGEYLCFGFGLCGGGYGSYAGCDRCGFFLKHQAGNDE